MGKWTARCSYCEPFKTEPNRNARSKNDSSFPSSNLWLTFGSFAHSKRRQFKCLPDLSDISAGEKAHCLKPLPRPAATFDFWWVFWSGFGESCPVLNRLKSDCTPFKDIFDLPWADLSLKQYHFHTGGSKARQEGRPRISQGIYR
jgi:hypothetical protein